MEICERRRSRSAGPTRRFQRKFYFHSFLWIHSEPAFQCTRILLKSVCKKYEITKLILHAKQDFTFNTKIVACICLLAIFSHIYQVMKN